MEIKGTRRTNTVSQISPERQVAQLVSGMGLEAVDMAIERRCPLTREIPLRVAMLKPAALPAAISPTCKELQE